MRRAALLLVLVLAGVVVSGFFGALVSLVQFTADSQDKLPVIVFWLLGSFATADAGKAAFQGEAGLSGALSSTVRIDLGYRHLSSGSSHANGLNGTLRIRW